MTRPDAATEALAEVDAEKFVRGVFRLFPAENPPEHVIKGVSKRIAKQMLRVKKGSYVIRKARKSG